MHLASLLTIIVLKMSASEALLSSFLFDSHLHVWGSGESGFPFSEGGEPPAELLTSSSATALLPQMADAKVRGALVVQPINYKFDHSYVANLISTDKRFKGMALLDPSADESYLPMLKEQGFVGVRFNPYLFDDGEKMSQGRGKEFYRQCGELGLPVGFMCFKGFGSHASDIEALLEAHPRTKCVIDHFGFLLQDGEPQEEAWARLLRLAVFPQVYIKISAFFRNSRGGGSSGSGGSSGRSDNASGEGELAYADLKPRVAQLVAEFGPGRLMYGSDFPFVTQQVCILRLFIFMRTLASIKYSKNVDNRS